MNTIKRIVIMLTLAAILYVYGTCPDTRAIILIAILVTFLFGCGWFIGIIIDTPDPDDRDGH